jgi:tetratricopeptide (TPR) repeat protein
MMRRLIKFLWLAALAVAPASARAEWKEASTRHFLVYSEGSEAKLRQAATLLEKYDFVLRWASQVREPGSPIKLKIYLMPSVDAVQATMGATGGSGVLGYYDQSIRGPYFVGLQRDPRDLVGIGAQQVLFHEYAHHFMLQFFPAAYPSWYVEGFAEYYGVTRILDGDVVETGHAVEGRYLTLTGGMWFPLKKMLTAKSYADVGDGIYALYAQGWLLVHYLVTNKERAGQLKKYLDLINAGRSFEAATNEAFGPEAKALDSELRAYRNRRAITAFRTPFRPIDVGPIAVRTLSPAEQALIKRDIDLSRGLLVSEAPDFAREVRGIARRFPRDPYALSILTEAERAAGNKAEAAAAIEAWLAVQPDSPKALMHKAQLQIDSLAAAKSADADAWAAARGLLARAAKAMPDDPMILEAYYDSYLAQGVLPPVHAQNFLYRAFEIVPQVDRVRYKVARDFEQRGEIADAIKTIKPAAYSLHSDADKSERQKRREEKLRQKYRQVGQRDGEKAWEMLARLEQMLANGGAAPGANDAGGKTRP